MIKDILSTDNKIYKQAKKLLSRQDRYRSGLFLAEGQRIVEDAAKSGMAEYAFITDKYEGELFGLDAYRISEKMFSALSDTQTTQGITAVCKIINYDISDIKGDTILICDGVSDPGNLGTLIRTAECADVGGIILLKGTTDPYSPKVVRSTMGSVFRMPIVFGEAENIKEKLSQYNIAVTVLDGSKNLYDIKFSDKTAVVVGNEAHGVSEDMIKNSDIRIKIPMCGNAESLNASVAGSVVMYEIYRQRMGT